MTDIFAGCLGEPPDKVFYEQWNVFCSFVKRRNGYGNVESVEKILAEGSRGHGCRKVAEIAVNGEACFATAKLLVSNAR